MNEITPNKAPSLKVVLPFYGTGALFFLVVSVLLLLGAGDLTGHYFSPHLLAVVHAAALGWGTMIIFGAAYELLPVVCARSLYSERLALASYALLTAGAAHLIPAFWYFRAGTLMIAGGSFVFLAACCYALNVFFTVADGRHSIHQYFLVSSACWLLTTVTLGVALAVNLRYPFMTRSHLDIMKLHAHVGLAGWFLQLVTGVSIKLIPMFLLSKPAETKWLYAALAFQNLGLLLLLAGDYLYPASSADGVYAAICAAGIGCWLWYLNGVRKNRMRRRPDILMKHTFVSCLFLIAALITLPLARYGTETKWVLVYGVFLFLGWLTSLILGQTFKTLPFIVWNERYKNLTGTTAVPLPRQLYAAKVVVYQYYSYLAAMFLLVAGMLAGSRFIITIALILWVGVAVLYVFNVAKVLFHQTIISPHEATR